MAELNNEESKINSEHETSHLDALQSKLYRRGGGPFPVKRSKFFQRNTDEINNWGNSEEGLEPEKPRRSVLATRLLNRLLLIAVFFFIISIGIALFVIFGGSNLISNTHINMVVRGPVTMRAGDEANFQVVITNQNKIPLETADLVLEFPTGTRSVKDISQDMPRFRQMIGRIEPGESVNVSAKAILLGAESSQKNVKINLEYRVPGSSALFEKRTDYNLTIGSSPLAISIDLPAEVIPNQRINFKVKAVSNADTVLRNVLLKINYPTGFQFSGANIEPVNPSHDTWALGDVAPNSQREIEISGVLGGQSDDSKAFRVITGTASADDNTRISAIFSDTFKTVTVNKPFVDLEMKMAGSNSLTIPRGKREQLEITWKNNLPYRIDNASVELKLAGASLDKTTVRADRAFYRSSDDMIIWDKGSETDLEQIEPGGTGKLTVEFMARNLTSGDAESVKDSTLQAYLTMRGLRISDTMANEPVEFSINKEIKVRSDIQLTAKTYYRSGQFTNTGPLPPKVDQETSYTIEWQLANTSNDLTDVKVKTILPINVRWVGNYLPANSQISYNPNTREVIWNLGNVKAGTGITMDPENVSFQVGVTPGMGNLHRAVPITQAIQVSGVDSFTGITLLGTKDALTSDLQFDEGFKFEEANVVP